MFTITVEILHGKEDAIEGQFECQCGAVADAVATFDCLIRGIRGHHRVVLLDNLKGVVLRESQVSWE